MLNSTTEIFLKLKLNRIWVKNKKHQGKRRNVYSGLKLDNKT